MQAWGESIEGFPLFFPSDPLILTVSVHAGSWGEYTLHVVKDCIQNLCPHTIGISKVQWSEKSTVPLRMEQGLVPNGTQLNLLCMEKQWWTMSL